MRIMVTGSRRWTDEKAVRAALLPWFVLGSNDNVVTLVTGGAEGADQQAVRAAKVLRDYINTHLGGHLVLNVETFRPQYRKGDDPWNQVAPLRRNDDMLDTDPDVVIAFQLGQPERGGTRYTIRHAQARGIPVWVVNHPEPQEEHVQADERDAA